MSNFEIRRVRPGSNISRKFTGTAKRGTAVGAHATDVEVAALAQGTNFLGFLTRDVAADGPSLESRVFPLLEQAFKSVLEVSLQKADEVECEGTDCIQTAGDGAVGATTAVGTLLSFKDGKWRVAQSGEVAFGMLTGNSGLNGSTLASENGGLRIRVEMLA